MKGITWGRDSHGLFDYESRHLTKRTMKTTNQTQIIRKVNELELFPVSKPVADDLLKEPETKQLLKIVNDNGKLRALSRQLPLFTRHYLPYLTILSFLDVFYLESFCQLQSSKVESKELNENMYLVVRSLKNNNQKIVSTLTPSLNNNPTNHFHHRIVEQ